MEAVALLV